MYLPATVSVGVIHCGINDINEASTHADRPHEIAENVILCGSKLKARHPLMSIIIVGILPIEEAFGGRKSSQIDKVNKILEESCQSHGFLFVEQARCWRDPSSGDINQSFFWRDGHHLNKKGCSMLAKIYADNIHNLLQLTQPHHYQPPTQDLSTIPPTPMSSCSYVHVPPPETTYSPNVAVHHHHCHNRPHTDKRRRYQRFLNTNVESRSKSKSNCEHTTSESVNISDLNVSDIKNSSVSYHGHVVPFMFSMLFVVLSLFLFSFCCCWWDGESIREVKVYACVCCTVNSLNIMSSDVKGLFCDLFRLVDMLTSASLKILCETLPVTTTLLKWIFIRHHFPLLFISLAYTIYNLVYSKRTWEIEMIYVLIIKTKNIITAIIAKNTVKNDYHLILKVFLIIIWIFLTYQGLHLQCCDNYQSEQPPDWQVQNSIVDASKNQICRLRSHIFLYSCSKICLKSVYKKKSYDILLLLLSGDIEKNPGPENWYSLNHTFLDVYFRTAIYLVFEGQKLLPKNEDDALVFIDVNDGFKDMKIIFKEQFELHLIDMKTLKKNISRFKVTNQKCGRDNCDAKDEYYDIFLPQIGMNLMI